MKLEKSCHNLILSKKVLGPIEEEAFFENNIGEEEYISENQDAKVKNKGKTLGSSSGNRDLL